VRWILCIRKWQKSRVSHGKVLSTESTQKSVSGFATSKLELSCYAAFYRVINILSSSYAGSVPTGSYKFRLTSSSFYSISSLVTSVRFTEAAFYSSAIQTSTSRSKLSSISNTRLENYTRYQSFSKFECVKALLKSRHGVFHVPMFPFPFRSTYHLSYVYASLLHLFPSEGMILLE
jgi:hypothetical protein